MHQYRTHTCGQLRPSDSGQPARLSGWVYRKRDHGSLLFIDLRDHYGLTQVVIQPDKGFFDACQRIRLESVLTFTGSSQIVIDVAGWFGPGAGGLAYLPSAPARLLDTRLNGGKPTNAENAVHVDGVSILNIAAVDSAALGYVTARPCGSPLLSSLINTTTGEDTANLIAVGGDAGGNVCVRSNILSQLVVDQVATFAP